MIREHVMSRHLSATNYRTMPWANGLGKTVELIRRHTCEGKLLWRLSMATVNQDGPFSILTDVERNLTVLTGNGFDLIEDESGVQHSAALLTPVAFSGSIPVTARNVAAPCKDFNVMTSRDLPKPQVWVEHQRSEPKIIKGPQLALFAISPSTVNTVEGVFSLKSHELLLCQKSAVLQEGKLICVALGSAYIEQV